MLNKLTRGNSISFLFFGEDGTVVAKIRAFCYNHVIWQRSDLCCQVLPEYTGKEGYI